jgi:hypothetical protein
MKNEKLELLLNKVVEYNQSGIAQYRGFLYKNGTDGYYIKVVEVDSGNIVIDEKVYLKESDAQFITQSEKPKLMRVSMKSWHYRLIKFVLGSNAPTPKTMQNGCPYFWLLLFSLFIVIFVLLGHLIKFIFLSIPKMLLWGLKKLTKGWVMNLDERQVYGMYWNNDTKMPMTAKIYFDKSDENFLDYFLLERYHLSGKINPEEYEKKKQELFVKYEQWREELAKSRQFYREEAQKREEENERRKAERERLQAIKKAKWDARMKPINDGFRKIFTSISNAFTFNPANLKNIIKRTKQFVGALITLFLLAVTYFAVNGLTCCLIAAIDWCIANWIYFALLGLCTVAVGIIYILYVLISGWLQNVVNKYQIGKKVWYIEPLIYLIWYPVKYVVLGIVYGFFYIICIPIKFIFYNFIFKLILAPLGILIWKLLKALGSGLKNSSGVFGEYFNASYSDYCPGIEWVDTEEE